MATELMWPEWVLKPRTVTPYYIVPTNTSGGRSATGSEQVIGNSPGRGRVDLSDVAIRTPEEERVWRVIALNLRGRANVIMVPAFARMTAPWTTVATRRNFSLARRVKLTDEILFSSGHALYPRTIAARAVSAVAAGATDIEIVVSMGSEIKAGQIFQAGEFAYPIKRVNEISGTDDEPVYSVTVAVPAREAIEADQDLEFDNPRFRARLAEDTGMALDMRLGKFGSPSVSFVEDV